MAISDRARGRDARGGRLVAETLRSWPKPGRGMTCRGSCQIRAIPQLVHGCEEVRCTLYVCACDALEGQTVVRDDAGILKDCQSLGLVQTQTPNGVAKFVHAKRGAREDLPQ